MAFERSENVLYVFCFHSPLVYCMNYTEGYPLFYNNWRLVGRGGNLNGPRERCTGCYGKGIIAEYTEVGALSSSL